MKTILLEGTELSGKTTLIKSLEELARTEGFSIKTNKGPINKSSRSLERLFNLAERVPPGNIRELCYTIGLILDKNPNEVYGRDSELFFQERSFPSIIAYSSVFHKVGVSKYLGKLLIPFYIRFDYNFLISCSNSEREKRFKERRNLTPLDNKIKEKIYLAEMLESKMKDILMYQKNYEEINTDNNCPKDVAKHILKLIV